MFDPVGQRVQAQQAVEPRFRRARLSGGDAQGRALRKGGLGPADEMGLQHHRPGVARGQIVEIDEPQQGRRRQERTQDQRLGDLFDVAAERCQAGDPALLSCWVIGGRVVAGVPPGAGSSIRSTPL